MTGVMMNARLRNYASVYDPAAMEQAYACASLPFIYPYMVTEPDMHVGKGAVVGSVIPTLGAIIPAAVGVDIGCGMDAVRLDMTFEELRALGLDMTTLRESIENEIPLSAGRYNQRLSASADRRVGELLEMPGAASADAVARNWPMQLGSLGSGNHFIEISVDDQGYVWLFLHSGSRGVGNKLAQKHIKIAEQFCADKALKLPNRDLAYLVEGADSFHDYIRDLRWAQEFARLNRAEMMSRVSDCFEWFVGFQVPHLTKVSCHHNYTAQEEHFGKQIYVSRKGAIAADEGVMGLIPGSMGASSYVVEGLGSTVGLCSAPHGAGRLYSRSAAKRQFDMADLTERMQARGINWRQTSEFLDEHPLAYKDIDVVMADAAELIKPVRELRQLVNVKGD